MHRRTFLATLPAIGAAGCLRLSDEPDATATAGPTVRETEETAGGTRNATPTATAERTTARPEETPDTETPEESALADRGPLTGAWPQFMFDAANTGWKPDGRGPDGPAELAWSYVTEMNLDTSLVAAGDVVYAADWSNTLYAVAARTGRANWTQRLPGSVSFGGPAVVDEIVVVGDHSDAVFGVNAGGGFRWQYEVSAPVWSAPTIADGTAFVTGSGGRVAALSLKDGEELWRFTVDGDWLFSTPAVRGGQVFVADSSADGTPPDDTFPLSPSFRDWAVDANSRGRLYALDAGSGTLEWSADLPQLTLGSPAVGPDAVYIGAYDSQLHAFDPATGESRWSFQTDDVISSTPAVTDTGVFVTSWDGALYSLDPADGTQRWFFPAEGQLHASPVVVDGTLYLSSPGTLYAIDPATGRERWHTVHEGGANLTPAVLDGVVFVGTDGRLKREDSNPGELLAFA